MIVERLAIQCERRNNTAQNWISFRFVCVVRQSVIHLFGGFVSLHTYSIVFFFLVFGFRVFRFFGVQISKTETKKKRKEKKKKLYSKWCAEKVSSTKVIQCVPIHYIYVQQYYPSYMCIYTYIYNIHTEWVLDDTIHDIYNIYIWRRRDIYQWKQRQQKAKKKEENRPTSSITI